ncbi:MAG: hypothetical protein KDJ19_07040, partial [Hyphomicrobiaceae bacterium]|nr:hypothetical protein [Hyphomicrobiaceae bacterium]
MKTLNRSDLPLRDGCLAIDPRSRALGIYGSSTGRSIRRCVPTDFSLRHLQRLDEGFLRNFDLAEL